MITECIGFTYLAGRYERREELLECKKELELFDIIVKSRWLNGLHDVATPEVCAEDDIEDLSSCQNIVLFTEKPKTILMRGGRMVELGYAIAQKKGIFIVGPRENVFCHLPQINQFDTFQEFVKSLK